MWRSHDAYKELSLLSEVELATMQEMLVNNQPISNYGIGISIQHSVTSAMTIQFP